MDAGRTAAVPVGDARTLLARVALNAGARLTATVAAVS